MIKLVQQQHSRMLNQPNALVAYGGITIYRIALVRQTDVPHRPEKFQPCKVGARMGTDKNLALYIYTVYNH